MRFARFMGHFSFPKRKRLLRRADFLDLKRSSRRCHTRHFVVILKQSGLDITRLGVSVSKKAGNAVKRNRVKRLIREFFRLNLPYFPQGYDIVIAAKRDASNLDFWEISEELGEVLSENAFPA